MQVDQNPSMPDETLMIRGKQDAVARLTGTGLLVEAAGVGVIALFASFIGELSGADRLVAALVIASGPLAGFLLIFVPHGVARALPGRLLLGLVALGQLGLLAVLAVQISGSVDPELGIDVGSLVFDFLAAAYAVVLLSGTLRTLAGPRSDSPARSRGDRAVLAALLGAGLCVALAGAAAISGAAGIRCGTFRFDSHRWATGDAKADGLESDRERIADTLVDCDALTGKTRGEVAAMLGPSHQPRAPRQHFYAGVVNDAGGPR